MTRLARSIVALIVLVPHVVAAQGLADVARAEQARRKTVPKATKVYTNGDLPAEARSRSALPAVPAGMVPASPQTPAEPTPVEPVIDPRRDEDYWRTRITTAREQVQRSRVFAEALQSRINALSADFVNRDDPAQRAVIGKNRQTALVELSRVQSDIVDLTKAITDIEEDARRAGVPPGWLR